MNVYAITIDRGDEPVELYCVVIGLESDANEAVNDAKIAEVDASSSYRSWDYDTPRLAQILKTSTSPKDLTTAWARMTEEQAVEIFDTWPQADIKAVQFTDIRLAPGLCVLDLNKPFDAKIFIDELL